MLGLPLLVWRLVRGDIRRRWIQSALLLAMMAAATSTLALALALRGVTDSPFARTRAATHGPDVAGLFEPGFHGSVGTLAQFVAFRKAPGVIASSGPYPVARLDLSARGRVIRVHAEGRDGVTAGIDQPLITAGSWVAAGRVVVERGFANALGVAVGNTIVLNGHRLRVRGIAVTAAMPTSDPLVWVTRGDLIALAGTDEPLWDVLNLTLSNPASATAFASERNVPNAAWFLESWQELRADDSTTIAAEQQLLTAGSALLAMIAIAGIAVLVGGRMAEQTRRVGMLKAVGATPSMVALVLLAENLLLALAAALVGVTAGLMLAPMLTSPGNSLLGSAGSPSLTLVSVTLTAALAVGVAIAATLVPALRGARMSTIRALSDSARPPQRQPGLIALSAHLPVPLLLALRLVARRPRRTLLGIASVAIAVASVVATFLLHHTTVLGARIAGNILATARFDGLGHVANVLSAILLLMAAINVVFATWVSVLDARRPTALARALGATPGQITAGFAGAQLAPALVAAALGIPSGLVLFIAAGGSPMSAHPPILWLLAVIAGTPCMVAVCSAIPARIGARRPAADVLRSDS